VSRFEPEEQIMSTQERANGSRALTAFLTGPARLVCANLIDPMRRRARRRMAAPRLAQLDDRLLRDIGLTRAQIHGAAYGLLRLGEPPTAGALRAPPPSDPANVVRLRRLARAVHVAEATSAPFGQRAAEG
jgi:uncharacterized protein YjiS (DUF1127 family)